MACANSSYDLRSSARYSLLVFGVVVVASSQLLNWSHVVDDAAKLKNLNHDEAKIMAFSAT
ncbi:MAG: hypothetical protein IPO17_04290 [Flavobacteriales bacterium]|nr:hypothetical protein [Flavobacteriales bacterium]